MDQRFALWLIACVLIYTNVVEGNKLLFTNMYKFLSKQEGNIVSSPFGANITLSLAYQGSVGETYDLFTKILETADARSAAENSHNLLSKYDNCHDFTLKMANKVIVMKNYDLKPEYQDIALKKYHTHAEEMNFAKKMESYKQINAWVRRNTDEEIREIVETSDLNSGAKFIMLSAIYFKGHWAAEFLPEFTAKENFYLLNDKIEKVEMMHISEIFFYAKIPNLNADIVEIPYTSNEISMYIILPNERNGISQLENDLREVDFWQVSKRMTPYKVNISLPKFRIESSISMEDILTDMGLGIIFTDRANFSKISNKPLSINKVIQKTVVEVSGNGGVTTNSSSEGVPLMESLVERRSNFIADHPFLFIVIDKSSSNLLFVGRVTNPNHKN